MPEKEAPISNRHAEKVLMVRPRDFRCNPQTALDNHFQSIEFSFSRDEMEQQVNEEFDHYVSLLHEAGIETIIFNQSDSNDTPDAIFPNNWFSTHQDAGMVLYPMKAPNRRTERREDIIAWLSRSYSRVIDLSPFELQEKFLEGTGSLVLDQLHRIAYAVISDRTHPRLVIEWAKKMNYSVNLFSAHDKNHNPIYHTNVVLCLGNEFAMICPEAINSDAERKNILESLKKIRPNIIELTLEQVYHFAANGLQLSNKAGTPVFILSKNGWDSLNQSQRDKIKKLTQVVTPDLRMIEQLGGGSARCMVAELY